MPSAAEVVLAGPVAPAYGWPKDEIQRKNAVDDQKCKWFSSWNRRRLVWLFLLFIVARVARESVIVIIDGKGKMGQTPDAQLRNLTGCR